MRLTTLIAVVLVGVLPATAKADDLSLSAAAGGRIQPLTAAKGKKAVALIFVLRECPISNAYAPEMSRIADKYSKNGVAFYLVYVDGKLSAADARSHSKEYKHSFPALLDSKHVWVAKTGATIAPEAAVLSPTGRLLYRGRINDLYPSLGVRRYEVRTHDLRNALDQIIVGRSPKTKVTKAVGCYISDAR